MRAAVCVKCKLFYKPKRVGVFIEEGMPSGQRAMPWVSYKVWSGDLHECSGCGNQIVIGFGQGAIAEHYQPDYAAWRDRAMFRVDDC